MPCCAAAARNAWRSNSLSDESRSKEPSRREREEKPARPLADALCASPRGTKTKARAPHAELVAKLPAKLALEDVDGLVLATMEVQGRALTRRGNGLERRQRPVRLQVTSPPIGLRMRCPSPGPTAIPLDLASTELPFQTFHARSISRPVEGAASQAKVRVHTAAGALRRHRRRDKRKRPKRLVGINAVAPERPDSARGAPPSRPAAPARRL